MSNWGFVVTVLEVHDGDTFRASADLGLNISVSPLLIRLAGVDAPELGSGNPVADQAKTRVQALLPQGATVRIASVHWDKYAQRVDALVTLPDGSDLATTLLNEGLVRHYSGSGPKPW
jgi:endonuclease YncB( thermonuclease family)